MNNEIAVNMQLLKAAFHCTSDDPQRRTLTGVYVEQHGLYAAHVATDGRVLCCAYDERLSWADPVSASGIVSPEGYKVLRATVGKGTVAYLNQDGTKLLTSDGLNVGMDANYPNWRAVIPTKAWTAKADANWGIASDTLGKVHKFFRALIRKHNDARSTCVARPVAAPGGTATGYLVTSSQPMPGIRAFAYVIPVQNPRELSTEALPS